MRRLCAKESLSIDTETTGLDYRKDTLKLVQISTDTGRVYMIRDPDATSYNLIAVLGCPLPFKIFHHAMFDLRFLKSGMRVDVGGRIECTKTLMKICHPEMQSGLGVSLRKIVDVVIDKKIFREIKNDWDAEPLSRKQVLYAAGDVLYLHKLLRKLKLDCKWHDLERYASAMTAIRRMASLQVEGYTDLFDYRQNAYDTTLEQRNWWLGGK